MRNADWERRNRAIAHRGRCGRRARRRAAPVARLGDRAVRGGARSRNGHWNAKMFAYVRLCSLMFAYVRLLGKKMLRAPRAASAARGHCAECRKSDLLKPTKGKTLFDRRSG